MPGTASASCWRPDMEVVLGLVLGIGALLVWWSWWGVPRRRRGRWAVLENLDDTLAAAGLAGVGAGGLLASAVGAGLAVALVVLAVSGSPVVSLVFACGAAWVPFAWVRSRARRRSAAMRDAWPAAIDSLASGVRAGLALPEALARIADRGPEELRAPFAAFAEDYRATGRFAESLDALKERLSDPVADRIVESMRLARELGGTEVGRVLRSLAAFLRDEARTRGELEARQSWTVNAARLAVAAPWILLAVLATRPEAVDAFDTAGGATVLLGGAVACAVAYRLMLRVGRLPQEPRVLR
ncbi:type II secretion system F family protein [Demequina lignilytica]